MKEADELVPWLVLNRFGLENLKGFTQLYRTFGSPGRILSLEWDEFRQTEGVNRQTWQKIGRLKDAWSREAEREVGVLKERGIRVLTLDDPEYPKELAAIWDPPFLLYCLGDPVRLSGVRKIAIVGSRFASGTGRRNARRLASELAGQGLMIVSGLARGIDTEAHEGALDAQGLTAAVLGSGIDRIYPPENQGLAARVADKGVLITEFPLGTPPDRFNFPRRNRIISGLCEATAVIEAARRSGSLITASFAVEQGREVFAVPGEISGRFSEGSNNLIKQGAQLVTEAKDILDALEWERPVPKAVAPAAAPQDRKAETATAALGPVEQAVLDCIGAESRGIEEIIAESGTSVPEAQSALLMLELNGYIRQEIGKRFRRI
jgi:DNA processing protein